MADTINNNRVTNNTYYDGVDWTFDHTTEEHHAHHHVSNHGGTFHGGTTRVITNVAPAASTIGVGGALLGIGLAGLGFMFSVAVLVAGGVFVALCAVAGLTIPRLLANRDNQRQRNYALTRGERQFTYQYELNEQTHRHRMEELAFTRAINVEIIERQLVAPPVLSLPAPQVSAPFIINEEVEARVRTNR